MLCHRYKSPTVQLPLPLTRFIYLSFNDPNQYYLHATAMSAITNTEPDTSTVSSTQMSKPGASLASPPTISPSEAASFIRSALDEIAAPSAHLIRIPEISSAHELQLGILTSCQEQARDLHLDGEGYESHFNDSMLKTDEWERALAKDPTSVPAEVKDRAEAASAQVVVDYEAFKAAVELGESLVEEYPRHLETLVQRAIAEGHEELTHCALDAQSDYLARSDRTAQLPLSLREAKTTLSSKGETLPSPGAIPGACTVMRTVEFIFSLCVCCLSGELQYVWSNLRMHGVPVALCRPSGS